MVYRSHLRGESPLKGVPQKLQRAVWVLKRESAPSRRGTRGLKPRTTRVRRGVGAVKTGARERRRGAPMRKR